MIKKILKTTYSLKWKEYKNLHALIVRLV